MFNRVESVKILLRANINIQFKNKIGLTALEIAKRTNNIDCSKQINLFSDGKPIGKIEWFFSLDEDYLSDGMEIEDVDFCDSKNAPRPSSMLLTKSSEFYKANEVSTSSILKNKNPNFQLDKTYIYEDLISNADYSVP
jgi:ankyrin repeat protein